MMDPIWQESNDQLTRTFLFKDFLIAFEFMKEVALVAEQQGHHPNWSNVYNKVIITLTTHDAGNTVTEKDRSLASKIDIIAQKYLP